MKKAVVKTGQWKDSSRLLVIHENRDLGIVGLGETVGKAPGTKAVEEIR